MAIGMLLHSALRSETKRLAPSQKNCDVRLSNVYALEEKTKKSGLRFCSRMRQRGDMNKLTDMIEKYYRGPDN